MKRTVELRVLVTTEDDSQKAADRIEQSVRRALGQWFDQRNIYVEQAKVKKLGPGFAYLPSSSHAADQP